MERTVTNDSQATPTRLEFRRSMSEKSGFTILRIGLLRTGLGIPIDPFSEHVEGKYTEVMMKPKLDERTGEHIDNVFAGTRTAYYIPFTPKNVQEIIADKVVIYVPREYHKALLGDFKGKPLKGYH